MVIIIIDNTIEVEKMKMKMIATKKRSKHVVVLLSILYYNSK